MSDTRHGVAYIKRTKAQIETIRASNGLIVGCLYETTDEPNNEPRRGRAVKRNKIKWDCECSINEWYVVESNSSWVVQAKSYPQNLIVDYADSVITLRTRDSHYCNVNSIMITPNAGQYSDGVLSDSDGYIFDSQGSLSDSNSASHHLNDSSGAIYDSDGVLEDSVSNSNFSDNGLSDSNGYLSDSDGILLDYDSAATCNMLSDSDGGLSDSGGILIDSTNSKLLLRIQGNLLIGAAIIPTNRRLLNYPKLEVLNVEKDGKSIDTAFEPNTEYSKKIWFVGQNVNSGFGFIQIDNLNNYCNNSYYLTF